MTTTAGEPRSGRPAPSGGVVDHELGFSWDDPRWLQDEEGLERRCRAYLEALRWPEGVRCPRCGSHRTAELPARKKFECRGCRYHFSVTAGTVFHNSHLPLWKWFLTVSLMLASDTGMPSNQLMQLLGGSYKTAWFAQHRVRIALEQSTREREALEDGEAGPARCLRVAVLERLVEAGVAARLFDRPLVGPYHQLSVKYAHAYVAEMEWRAMCRRSATAFRDTLLTLLDADPVGFEELVGAPGRGRAKSQDR